MIYLILATLLLTVLTIFAALASRNLNTNIVTAIVHTSSIFIPFAVAIPAIVKKEYMNHKFGIIMAIAAGLSVGLYGLTINKAFTVNKLGVVTPAIFGGAILLSTLAGYFLFKETLSTLEFIGLIFVLAGFCLIVYARSQTGYEA
jgi:drug/metabolite transporter (DMT)-like permease